jgi:hypothetical protein
MRKLCELPFLALAVLLSAIVLTIDFALRVAWAFAQWYRAGHE